MKRVFLKCVHVFLAFTCMWMLVGNSTTTVYAKKDKGKMMQLDDVLVEVLNGNKWIKSTGEDVKVKQKNNELTVSSFRINNPNDYDMDYSVLIDQQNISWKYFDENGNELESISGVLGPKETSEMFVVKGYVNTNSRNKQSQLKDVDLLIETKEVEKLSDTPYYAINTDVDLVIDEEGKTIQLFDNQHNYLASVDGQKITYSNATITGQTYVLTFGIYRSPSYATFNNEINDVNVTDLVVSNGVYNGKDAISNAVYAYGNSVLNNCHMTGTTTINEGYKAHDIGFVNKSNSVINGGEYGSIYVWSQAHLTINNASVDNIDCATITTRNLGMLTIGKGSHVKTINLTTGGWEQYEPALTIEEGAIVDKIIYRGKTYSQKEWNNPFYGKYISILGDSISTYTGWSDVNPITSEDCVNRYGEAYYGPVGGDFHNTDLLVTDTWWHQAADKLGAEILMSNAGNSTGLLCASYPANADWDLYLKEMLAYKSRPYYLGKDGINPDIIALYIGSNEVARATKSQFGSIDDVDFETLIIENEDGTYTYATPQTVAEAYCIMLHKIQVTYPNAEIYCFAVVPNAGGYLKTINSRVGNAILFNEMVKGVANHYGAIVVDLFEAFNVDPDGDGVVVQEDFDVFQTHFNNDPHPTASGFDVITDCFVDAVKNNSKYNQ